MQVVTGSTAVEASLRQTIDPAKGARKIQQQIEDSIQKLGKGKNIAGIGVGFGGPVDHQSGIIRVSHQVPGWDYFPLKAWLENLTGKPVCVDNDANVAALGEAVYGAGRGCGKVFYMTIGSGIGGGMVIDGKIYHGRAPGEVEIGHIRMDKSGATLESRCSGWAVNRKVKDHMAKYPESRMAKMHAAASEQEARLLLPALVNGDTDALQLMDEITDDLAFALSHIVHLFNPDILVIGGGLSHLQQHLQNPLEARLTRYLMHAMRPAPPLKMAMLGEAVVPVGALALANNKGRQQGN